MTSACRQCFALRKEPFAADIAHGEIMVTPVVSVVEERIGYAMRLGAMALSARSAEVIQRLTTTPSA